MYEIKILSRNTTDAGFIYITDWEHYDNCMKQTISTSIKTFHIKSSLF